MADNLFLGRGGGGIDRDSALAQDIRNMSDPAKQARRVQQGPTPEQQTALQGLADVFGSMPGFQSIAEGIEGTYAPAMEQQVGENLQAAFDDDPDAQMRSLTDQMAGRIIAGVQKEQGKTADGVPDADKLEAEITKKAQQLLKHSEAVGKSGTNNTLAQQIYKKVYETLLMRLSSLQDQGVKDMTEEK